jgi:fibronectin type 3 domain-containing protein
VCTGVVVVGVCLLWGLWFGATGGAGTASAGAAKHKHSVTLTWNASTSPVAGYNVYRSMVKGRDYVKINAKLIRDRLSYKDENVESGKTYYYVTRSVDAKGNESEDSNATTVVVP